MISGATLPNPMAMHSSITLPQSIIAVGGRNDRWELLPDLYEITCRNDRRSADKCQVTKLVQELQYPRARMVAVLVPDEFTECEK